MIKFTVSNSSVYADGTRSDSNEVNVFDDKLSFIEWLQNSCPYTLSVSTVKHMLKGITVRFTNDNEVVSHTTIFTVENTEIGFWEKLLNKLRGKKNGS